MPVAGQHETGAPHRFGGVLWQRNFRLLWVGESISAVGNAMAVVGMPLLAVEVLHASTFVVAALTAAAPPGSRPRPSETPRHCCSTRPASWSQRSA